MSGDLEDEFLEELLHDEQALDYYYSTTGSMSPSSHSSISSVNSNSLTADNSEEHVVYTKKRKYEWKKGEKERMMMENYRRITQKRYKIVFPRILKNDIRRKYLLMYANVMNSYNYHLIYSFFQQFFSPDVTFEKKLYPNTPAGMSPCTQQFHVILEGLQPIICYFLLLLQLCPDKVTNVSELQLKQSTDIVDKTEVCGRFSASTSRIYDTTPLDFVQAIQHDLDLIISAEKEEANDELISRKKSRICDGIREGELALSATDQHRSLFDPLFGTFLQSRFSRIDSPVSYRVEGQLSLIVNSDKRVERIVVTPLERFEISK